MPTNSFSSALQKARLEFAKANPQLSDAQINAQFDTTYQDPTSILRAITQYRATGSDSDRIEAQKAAQSAMRAIEYDPATLKQFDELTRGASYGGGILGTAFGGEPGVFRQEILNPDPKGGGGTFHYSLNEPNFTSALKTLAEGGTPKGMRLGQTNIMDYFNAIQSGGSVGGSAGASSVATQFLTDEQRQAREDINKARRETGTFGDFYQVQQPSGQKASVSSSKDLQQMLDAGLISPYQFEQARNQLMKGFTGVNPYGFTEGAKRGDLQQALQTYANLTPSQKAGLSAKFGSDVANQVAKGGVTSEQIMQSVQGLGFQPSDMATQNPIGMNYDTGRTGGLARTGGMRGSVGYGDMAQGEQSWQGVENEQQRLLARNAAKQPPITPQEQELINRTRQNGTETPSGTSSGGQSGTGQTGGQNAPTGTGGASGGTSDGGSAGTGGMSMDFTGLSNDFMAIADPTGSIRSGAEFAGMIFEDAMEKYRKERIESQTLKDEMLDNADEEWSRKKVLLEKDRDIMMQQVGLVRENQIAQQRLDQARAESVAREDNIKREAQNRVAAAALGINYDSNGLRWMQEEARKGSEYLSYLIQKGSLEASRIADLYSIDLQNIDITSQEKYNTAYTEYKSSRASIKKDFYDDERERMQDEQEQINTYVTRIFDLDKEKRDAYRTALKDAQDRADALAKKELDDKMTTKDKLGYIGTLDSQINSKQTIKIANDVDGFYGAMVAGYDEVARILNDPNAGKESLNAAMNTAAGSFARILDPGSVVRNEEFERQMYGQSWINAAKGWFTKAKRGGSGLEWADIESMKKVADQIHAAWESRLQAEMQPIIARIDTWNSDYPEAEISYSEVFNIDRIHLPEQKINTWSDAANSTTSRTGLGADSSLVDFFSVYAPSADNNNPQAYATAVASDLGVSPSATIGSLDVDAMAQAIAKHEGFTSGASRLAVVNNNPGNLRYIGQSGATQGEGGFAKFPTVEAGWEALRNDIRAKQSGVSRYSKPENTIALIPSAYAAEYDLEDQIVIQDLPEAYDPINAEDVQIASQAMGMTLKNLMRDMGYAVSQTARRFPSAIEQTAEDIAGTTQTIAGGTYRNVLSPFFQGITQ